MRELPDHVSTALREEKRARTHTKLDDVGEIRTEGILEVRKEKHL